MSTDDTSGGNAPGGAKEPPGAPKRPTPTIELQAEDVTAHEPVTTDEAAPEANAGEEEQDAEPRAEERVRAFRAPQRTDPSALRGLATHLAAGLLGGLIGVIAMGYGLGHLPLGELLSREPAEAPATAAQVEALESRLAEVQGIAEQARERASALGDVQDRVAQLETTLKGFSEAAQQGGGELAQAAALASRIAELGDRVDALQGTAAASAALKSDIDALRQRLDRQAAGPTVAPQLTGQIDELSQRLGKLEQDVAQAGKAAQAGGAQARAAALALAYANLERAVASGKPYATELAAVEQLAPAGTDLAALKDRAAQGVPTLSALQASFGAHARAAAAGTPPAADGWLDRLMDTARSVVTIRRTTPEAGTGADAILARMSDRLNAGDVAGAVEEGEALRGAPREAMQPWLDEAGARLTATGSLEALEARLVAGLAPGTSSAPAQAGR